MNVNDIMNNLRQEHAQSQPNDFIFIEDVFLSENIPNDYERSLHFQKGYERRNLPCPYIQGLLKQFTQALGEKCKQEGIHFTCRREQDGMLYLLADELYKVTNKGYACEWNFQGFNR